MINLNTMKTSRTPKSTNYNRWIFSLMAGLCALVFGLTLTSTASAASTTMLKATTKYKTYKDLRYSNATASKANLMDLYVPDNGKSQVPLIIWVHGGGWEGGDKATDCIPALNGFVQRGFAVACINYRLTNEAQWPAQIIDVKTAVRALRANAAAFKLYPTKIGLWGASAGGHLAAVAATSSGVSDFEKGEFLTTSSKVQIVADDFGPTDFVKWVQTPGLEATLQPADSFVSKLFGGPVLDNQAKAATANPITYVNAGDAPIAISHGDQDPIVPLSQSQMFYSSLQAAGVTAALNVVPGGTHGGGGFYSSTRLNSYANMFDGWIRP